MSVHLPVDVTSPDQLSSLVAELQTYQGKLRDAGVRAKTTKSKIEPPDASEALFGLLKGSAVSADDGPALDALSKELSQVLKKAPVMHLTLAGNAGRTLRRQLTVWFRTQVHPHSLLTFAIRTDIGGGLMLQAGSHFYDYSFRDRLLANKSRLMELASVR
jgi:hypothetical protein